MGLKQFLNEHKNILGGAFVLLLVILGITYRLDPERFSSNFPNALVAWGTATLAVATFFLIWSSKKQEGRRRQDELDKERRDRKEHLLNEIIEWAIDVARCGSTVDFPTILEDIGKLPEEATKIQEKIWRSTFINLLFRYQAIDAKSEYINNAALIFEKEVSDTVAEVIDKLDKVIDFVPELVKNVMDEETKDKLSELEHSLQKTATTLIRVATKIKTKDIGREGEENMSKEDEVTGSNEPTLKDIEEHLKRQDRQTKRMIYFAGAAFGASIILVAISLWIGRIVLSATAFFWEYIFLVAIGFGFMSWCWYKQRKIKG